MGFFMPAPTFAEQMLASVEEKLLSTNAAISSAGVGGNSVQYRDRDKLLKERDYWRQQVGLEKGTFRRAQTINLAGAG